MVDIIHYSFSESTNLTNSLSAFPLIATFVLLVKIPTVIFYTSYPTLYIYILGDDIVLTRDCAYSATVQYISKTLSNIIEGMIEFHSIEQDCRRYIYIYTFGYVQQRFINVLHSHVVILNLSMSNFLRGGSISKRVSCMCCSL